MVVVGNKVVIPPWVNIKNELLRTASDPHNLWKQHNTPNSHTQQQRTINREWPCWLFHLHQDERLVCRGQWIRNRLTEVHGRIAYLSGLWSMVAMSPWLMTRCSLGSSFFAKVCVASSASCSSRPPSSRNRVGSVPSDQTVHRASSPSACSASRRFCRCRSGRWLRRGLRGACWRASWRVESNEGATVESE